MPDMTPTSFPTTLLVEAVITDVTCGDSDCERTAAWRVQRLTTHAGLARARRSPEQLRCDHCLQPTLIAFRTQDARLREEREFLSQPTTRTPEIDEHLNNVISYLQATPLEEGWYAYRKAIPSGHAWFVASSDSIYDATFSDDGLQVENLDSHQMPTWWDPAHRFACKIRTRVGKRQFKHEYIPAKTADLAYYVRKQRGTGSVVTVQLGTWHLLDVSRNDAKNMIGSRDV